MHGLCTCMLSCGQTHELVTGDQANLMYGASSFEQICQGRGCCSSAGFSLASRLHLYLRHEPRPMQLLHHVCVAGHKLQSPNCKQHFAHSVYNSAPHSSAICVTRIVSRLT